MTRGYECLPVLGAHGIVRDVVAAALLVAGQQRLQFSVRLNRDLVVVRRAAEERVRDHSQYRYDADHDVPRGQISGLGLVLRDNQAGQQNAEGAKHQTDCAGNQR